MRSARRRLLAALGAWFVFTAVGCLVVWSASRIDPVPMPDVRASTWTLDALEAAVQGKPLPPAPAAAEAYRAAGSIVFTAWSSGVPVAQHHRSSALKRAVAEAGRAFHGAALPREVRFTVEVPLGVGAMARGIPWLENLSVVPLREGLRVRVGGKEGWATPQQLLASGAYDGSIRTPIPDLRFGVPLPRILGRLARDLGHDLTSAEREGLSVERVAFGLVSRESYPRATRVDEKSLRQAAVEGAQFLLRHQRPDGRFTYIYNARTDRPQAAAYNVPRHAGTSYFLAQVHNVEGLPGARAGARRALEWARRDRTRACGGPDRLCVDAFGRVDLGSTALSALAAAEYLQGGDDPQLREWLEGLTAFLRSMQRPDGEFMHEYDLRADRPIDIQGLYYSGEAAVALLRAHEVLGRRSDLTTAQAAMKHLAGAAWNFLGSRYYYGEEHWTCMAASSAAKETPVPEAAEFCHRWAAFNREVQYGPSETPWASSGGYGVGPVLLPRLTPVASRTEAMISVYEMTAPEDPTRPALRTQIERGLGMLLRWRWAPGPTHLFADPDRARGGMPGSPAELIVRNDYVQHAASAMIRWAEILRREQSSETRAFAGAGFDRPDPGVYKLAGSDVLPESGSPDWEQRWRRPYFHPNP